MRRHFWIMPSLMMVLALTVTGCPTETSPAGGDSRVIVLFDANGGTFAGGPTFPVSIPMNTAVTLPQDPTWDDLVLIGWSLNIDGTAPWNFSTPVSHDIILYARWEGIRHLVTFDLQGASPADFNWRPVHYWLTDTPILEPFNEPFRDGYDFIGWYADAAGTTPWDFSTLITEPVTIYAIWDYIFTVTFDSNGGTPVPDQKIRLDQTATEPPVPSRTGTPTTAGLYRESDWNNWVFTFNGWFLGSSSTPFDFNTPINGDITLAARWTAPNIQPITLSGPNSIVNRAIDYVDTNAGSYVLALDTDVTVNRQWAIDSGLGLFTHTWLEANKITLIGLGSPKIIRPQLQGLLFFIMGSAELVIGENIILAGIANLGVNNVSLVQTELGGSFVMLEGSAIILNNATADGDIYGGAAVSLSLGWFGAGGSSFTMKGGEITSNITPGFVNGSSGLHVGAGATVDLQGGAIIENLEFWDGTYYLFTDVFIQSGASNNASSITLSGESFIDIVNIQSTVAARNTLGIGSNWLGSVGTVNFLGQQLIATVVGWWRNQPLLTGQVTAVDVNYVGLGIFIHVNAAGTNWTGTLVEDHLQLVFDAGVGRLVAASGPSPNILPNFSQHSHSTRRAQSPNALRSQMQNFHSLQPLGTGFEQRATNTERQLAPVVNLGTINRRLR
ncbi:MAG: InlB B-repeat-containing protein [Treponema sp.]|nr:InlB B-repeat-containing protein [Treponema sp.]